MDPRPLRHGGNIVSVVHRWLIIFTTIAVFAAPLRDPSATLAQGRKRIADAIRKLPRYTCMETINRRYFELRGSAPKMSCDDLTARKHRGDLPVDLVAADRLRLQVAVADRGSEMYSWPGTGQFEGKRIDEFAGGGPSSSGPFGPFLVDIFLQPPTEFIFRGEDDSSARIEMNYRFSVPLSASHYTLWVGDRRRTFSYDGSFALDADTGDLRQLTVRTSELPNSPACEATSMVAFEETRIGAGIYLLPKATTLHILRRNGDETENTTLYTACHEFRGESELRFDDQPEIAATTQDQPLAPARKSFPPGIRMKLSLQTAIDSSTAAAGDRITAVASPELLDPKSLRYIPRNTIIKGRITHLERNFVYRYVLLSLAFDSMETPGGVWQCAAKLNRKIQPADGSDYWKTGLISHTSFPEEGTLVFHAPRGDLVIPRGFTSAWVTVAHHRR